MWGKRDRIYLFRDKGGEIWITGSFKEACEGA